MYSASKTHKCIHQPLTIKFHPSSKPSKHTPIPLVFDPCLTSLSWKEITLKSHPNCGQILNNEFTTKQSNRCKRQTFHFTTMHYKSHYTDCILILKEVIIKDLVSKNIQFCKQEYIKCVIPIKIFHKDRQCILYALYRGHKCLENSRFHTFRFHKLVKWHYCTWNGIRRGYWRKNYPQWFPNRSYSNVGPFKFFLFPFVFLSFQATTASYLGILLFCKLFKLGFVDETVQIGKWMILWNLYTFIMYNFVAK